jgi:imidazolonepropionase
MTVTRSRLAADLRALGLREGGVAMVHTRMSAIGWVVGAAETVVLALLDAGAVVALATDFNPGTSPTVNFPLILTLAVSQLRLSAAEAVVAGTVNGAAALGLADRVGQLAPGFSADLALFDAEDYRELPYWYGDRRCRASWTRGKPCHVRELGLIFDPTPSGGQEALSPP